MNVAKSKLITDSESVTTSVSLFGTRCIFDEQDFISIRYGINIIKQSFAALSNRLLEWDGWTRTGFGVLIG